MLSIAENNPTPGSKHYHVLSSLSLSEPRMSSALSSASKITRYFPFVPTFVGKLSNWEIPCIPPGSQISNGNVIRTANEGSARERGAISKCLIPHVSEVSDMEKWGVHIIHWKQECLNMFLSRKQNLIVNMFIDPKPVMKPNDRRSITSFPDFKQEELHNDTFNRFDSKETSIAKGNIKTRAKGLK